MNYKQCIRADYSEYIRLHLTIPRDLKDSLKTNERVPFFIDNMANELKKCELAGLKLDRLTVKNMVYNMTEVFIQALMAAADKNYKSDLEKQRLQAEQNMDRLLDKNGNADLKDMGIKIQDG